MPPKAKKPYKPLTPRQQAMAKRRRAVYKARHPYLPPRLPTVQTLMRQLHQQADATAVFKYMRVHGTDVERLLVNNGFDRKLAKYLSPRDVLELKAGLTGLKPGRLALTLPERLVIQWMEANHYEFGGVYPNVTNQFADFFSQYPIGGGRNTFGGGLVADIFISDKASRTNKGVVLAVDGNYWHSSSAVSGRDNAQNTLLMSQGYVVARIKDTQTYDEGSMETFMRGLLGNR